MSVRASAVWAITAQYASFTIQFISSVLIARWFIGPDELGLFSIAFAAVTMIALLQDFETETRRLTDGRGVHVVYDGVGKDTFARGLKVLRPRGYLVLFGGASGAVPPFDLLELTKHGSLFITRPSLQHYVATREELEQRSRDVFEMIGAGKLALRIHKKYPLEDVRQAHYDLEGRKTTGKLLLIP